MFYEKSMSGIGLDAKKYLELYRENPVASRLTVEQLSNLAIEIHSKNFGSTVSMLYGNMAQKPFHSVSIFPDIGIQIPGESVDRDVLEKFIKKYEGLLSNPKCALGTWYNNEDGMTYLDISVLVDNKEIAIRLSKEYNQIGIFDLGNMEYIPTEGSGISPPNLKPLGQRLDDL